MRLTVKTTATANDCSPVASLWCHRSAITPHGEPKMKRILIALALSAALVTPAISGAGLATSCTTFTANDTLNARSIPNGKVVVGEFISGTEVLILDSKQVNRHPWAFVTGSSAIPREPWLGEVNIEGWVYAEYLTRCRSEVPHAD
jgi:hypothetical protein